MSSISRLQSECVRYLLLGALVTLHASDATGQGSSTPAAIQVEVGVDPATVTVGDPFRSVLRIVAPAGVSVEYPEFPNADTLAAVSPRQLVPAARGGEIAVYTLVSWAAVDSLVATLPLRLTDPAGVVRVFPVRLRLPRVRSVLPAGDTLVPPRPPRGLFVPAAFGDRAWWWLLLVVLAALAAGGFGYALLARRRGAEEAPTQIPPRLWALRQLERLADIDNAEEAGAAEVFRHVSWVLRNYLCRVEPSWSADLTTTELLERLRFVPLDPKALSPLERLLLVADRVKFSGRRAEPGEAKRLLEEARVWVESYPPAIPDEADRGRAA